MQSSRHHAAAGILLAVIAGCGETEDESVAPSSTDVVATSGALRVSSGDVLAYLEAAGPHTQRRFTASADERKKIARELMRTEALYTQARRQGFHQRPQVQQQWKRLVVNAYLKDLRDGVRPEDVSEAEVERTMGDSTRPRAREQVRVARLRFSTESEARAAHHRLEASANPFADFLHLAREQAGPGASAAATADLGFLERDSTRQPRAVVDAAFSISKHLGIAAPVKTPDGWVLLLRTAYRAADDGTVDQAQRRAARTRLLLKRREAVVDQAVRDVVNLDDVEIRADVLDRIHPPDGKE